MVFNEVVTNIFAGYYAVVINYINIHDHICTPILPTQFQVDAFEVGGFRVVLSAQVLLASYTLFPFEFFHMITLHCVPISN